MKERTHENIWFLVNVVLIMIALFLTAPSRAQECTQVIGFSQTGQWYSAGFENFVSDANWQAKAVGGAAIHKWADPTHEVWSTKITSPCSNSSSAPDRVVLTISDRTQDVSAWVTVIDQAVTATNMNVPSATTILLQPVVGGPGEALCPASNGGSIRATTNHPVIDDAIALVAANSSINTVEVQAGFSPEVEACSDYRDNAGHMNNTGNTNAARNIGTFYAGGVPVPDPDPDPDPEPEVCPVPDGKTRCLFLKRRGECRCR